MAVAIHTHNDILRAWAALLEGAAAAKKLASSALAAAAAAAKAHVDKSCFLLSGCAMHVCVYACVCVYICNVQCMYTQSCLVVHLCPVCIHARLWNLIYTYIHMWLSRLLNFAKI